MLVQTAEVDEIRKEPGERELRLYLIVERGEWLLPRALWLLLAAGSCVYVAYTLGIVAMRTGEIAVVSPFRYTLVVMALILSYAIWGHVPDQWALMGIAVVTAAGVYLLHRERVVARGLAAARDVKTGTA